MAFVRAKQLSTDGLLRRLACGTLAAGAVGALSAYIRPMISGPVHYEAMVSLFVIMPAICLGIVWSMRCIQWQRVSGRLIVTVSLTCVAYAVGWSLTQRRLWDDMVGVMLVYGIIAVLASWLLLVVIQYFRRPLYGPYCPSCAYCLIGAPKDRCPECGRDFTLAELGVTRDELQAGGITSGCS